MKSEPNVYALADLARDKRGTWDGVRNYQARNFMRAMKKGDWVIFYHSNATPSAIVGLAEVVKEAYPDATQFDPTSEGYDAKSSPQAPRWDVVDVAFVETFATPLSLQTIKADPAFAKMALVTRARLSVQPVEHHHMQRILACAGSTQRL